MEIKFLGELKETCQDFSFTCTNITGVFSAIKFRYGERVVNKIYNNEYGYIIGRENEPDSFVSLRPEVLFTSFSSYDTLYICPRIEGETGVELAIGLLSIVVVTMVIGMVMAFTMGRNREILNDPSLKSNLFSGSPLIREEGGIVPLVYGNPYCGGVLISSGLYTTHRLFPGLLFGGVQ